MQERPQGYLPPDQPPLGAMISLGFQHVLTMFPATVLVALLTGFDVGVTLFASGLATVIAIVGSGMRIPMYYGSSFSYIAAIRGVTVPAGATAPNPALAPLAQVGIVGTAVVNVFAGLIVRAVGKARLDRVLPPVVTGSVAVVIGIALGKAALDMATGTCCGSPPATWWTVTIFAIAPIAIATIPESTAHLYQISLYIDRVAEELGRKKLEVKKLIGLNLILDGVGDGVNGLLGGCAGTNYGENNSLMVITRNYSAPVLVAAGVIGMLLGFVGKLAALVGTLPTAVTGILINLIFLIFPPERYVPAARMAEMRAAK